MEEWKDFLQLGFSFFVAGYLLIVTQKTLTLVSEKLTEVITELKHLNDKIEKIAAISLHKTP